LLAHAFASVAAKASTFAAPTASTTASADEAVANSTSVALAKN
jgi:hypothetical protein